MKSAIVCHSVRCNPFYLTKRSGGIHVLVTVTVTVIAEVGRWLRLSFYCSIAMSLIKVLRV